ncbi:MAG: Ig-like domain-containing protein, partial [Sandaracinaceae bacterium]
PDLGGGGIAPFVVFNVPQNQAEDIQTDTNILLVFSESMDPTVGTVSIDPSDVTLNAADGIWLRDCDFQGGPPCDDPSNRENIAVIVDPPEFMGGIQFTVTVNCDFEDAGGTGLRCDEPTGFIFTTEDIQPPVVVECSPSEGGVNLSAIAITEVSCKFNEQMNTAVGSLRIIPAQPLRDAQWTEGGTRVTWELVRQLPYDTTYQAILEDFIDRSENPLDPMPYLGNGVIDFSTGPDADEPIIVVTVPTEGQMGVNPALTGIRVEFNEPMDVEIPGGNRADLTDLTTSSVFELTGDWNGDGTVLTFPIPAGTLMFMTDYELDFSVGEYRDVNGNLLDTTTYLVDGILNFRVDTDVFGPRVLSSDPEEGEVDVDVTTPTISVQFDEPMNAEVTEAVLSDGTRSTSVTGAWSAANTIIDFDIRTAGLLAGRPYTLELRNFEDETGNALDSSDVYLGDGVLDFRTADPNGEDCTQPLTTNQATSTPTGGFRWLVPSDSFADDGSTDSCDSDSAGGAGDIVIEYVKSTGTLADGGDLLSIGLAVDSTSTFPPALNFEVRAGICGTEEENADAIIGCQETVVTGGGTYDLPAGTYYIWVAKESGGAFPGATVTIEEIPAWPEGESCNAPFTTASSAVYVPPRMPGGPHTFQIRPALISTFDRAAVSNTEGEISCATEHGADAVVEFTKMPGSVLQIRAIPVDIRSQAADLNMEVSLGCDPTLSSYQSLSCDANFDRTRTVTVSGPGGPVYVWVSSDDRDNRFGPFPGATVEITEISVGTGEACGTARSLTGPSAEVTLDSTRGLGGSNCIIGDRNITWFSYTPTEDIAIVEADESGSMLLADQVTNLPLICQTDATRPTPALIRSGRTLCIGIPNDSDITELTFTEREYDGIGGVVTDTGITRPLDDSGSELRWNAEPAWMATDDLTLYFGLNGFGFSDPGEETMFVPKAGMAQAVLADGISDGQMGWTGFTIGSDLYTVDDTTSTSSSTNRLYLATDGMTFPWMPEEWDGTSTSYDDDIQASSYDGTSIYLANNDFSETRVWELDPASSTNPVQVARWLDIEYVIGIAVDEDYAYMQARYNTGLPFPDTYIEGLFRVPRSDWGTTTAVPETIATWDTSCCDPGEVFLDDPTDPTVLYVRQNDFGDPNTIHVVLDPASANPLYVGPIVRLGRGGLDHAYTYDADENALFLFEAETVPQGRIVRID